MTILFSDNGGEAGTGVYSSVVGTVVASTDKAHTGSGSLKHTAAAFPSAGYASKTISSLSAGRISGWFNLSNLPSQSYLIFSTTGTSTNPAGQFLLLSTGVVRFGRTDNSGAFTQLGADLGTISVGNWYQLSTSFNIASSTSYTFNTFFANPLGIINQQTITYTGTAINTDLLTVNWGWQAIAGTSNTGQLLYTDNQYIDDVNDLSYVGGDPLATYIKPFMASVGV